MDISNQIRTRRRAMGLSQDELAQRIYVSRQTISNWETDRTYPDIQSLLLLSDLFGTTIDVLVKGDLEMMKNAVAETNAGDAKKLRGLSNTMLVATLVALGIGVAGFVLLPPWGWVLGILPYAVGMVAALRAERIKRDNDIQTYREIVAFMDGQADEQIEQIRSQGRTRGGLVAENALKLLVGGLAGAGIAAVLFALFRAFGL